jgi:hypothetical protein
LAFPQLRDFLAADEGGELLVEVAGRNAVSTGALTISFDTELGNR